MEYFCEHGNGTFGFHKMWGISCLSKELVAFQERLLFGVGWLVGWLVDWLVGWLVGGLVGWLVGCLVS